MMNWPAALMRVDRPRFRDNAGLILQLDLLHFTWGGGGGRTSLTRQDYQSAALTHADTHTQGFMTE